MFPKEHISTYAAGQKGGRSKSALKQRAARRNGMKGGRKPTRTLAELLLHRKITTTPQGKATNDAFRSLYTNEQDALIEYFGLPRGSSPGDRQFLPRIPRRRSPNKLVLLAVKKFRLQANYNLGKLRPSVLPIYWEWQKQSPEAADQWFRIHPDGPPPPRRKVRLDIEALPYFKHFEMIFRQNPKLTVNQVIDGGGAQYTERRAKCLLEYLRSKSDPAQQNP